MRGTGKLSGDISSGQSVVVQSGIGGANATLTAATGFTNSGDITLDSTQNPRKVTLNVSSGTLTNAAVGVINVNTGAGGERTISAHLLNNGVVNLKVGTVFFRSTGVYTNNGTINIPSLSSLTISGLSQVFNQEAGTLAIDGAFSMSGATTLNFNGGEITGTPVLSGSSLNIGAGGTSPAAFVMRGTSTLNGNISVGQRVVVQSGINGANATLTAATGFTNSGDITLESTQKPGLATLRVSSGTLTNAATGVINVNTGAGGARIISAHLLNNGVVNLNAGTLFSRSGGIYANNGTINIPALSSLNIISASQVFNQESGSLAISGAFSMSGASTLNFNGGTITGTPVLSGSSLNIGARGTSPAAFVVRGTSKLSGDISSGQRVVVQSGINGANATLTAATGFTNSGDITLESTQNPGLATLRVSSGTLTNAATGVINADTGAGGTRTISAEVHNAGTVNVKIPMNLGRTGSNHINSGSLNIDNAVLTVIGTTFTNGTGGAISASGALDVSGVSFTNNGQISPGVSPGILVVTGDYTQGGLGSLNIEIGGLTPGADFDQLNITGAATLDGKVMFSLVRNYLPSPGDRFQFMGYASRSGQFSEQVIQIPNAGVRLNLVYEADNATLVAIATCGNVDGDGDRDRDDVRKLVDLIVHGGFTSEQARRGNVVVDGELNAGDAVVLLRFVDGLIQSLNCGPLQ